MTAQLAEFLKLARKEKDLSLRAVEEETGISNAYLSQLERGVASSPSPAYLKKLSDCYGCTYESLMRLAGYIKDARSTKPKDIEEEVEIALMATGLSAEQVLKVMEYAQYVRHEERKRAKG